jgi:hypothetical protein
MGTAAQFSSVRIGRTDACVKRCRLKKARSGNDTQLRKAQKSQENRAFSQLRPRTYPHDRYHRTAITQRPIKYLTALSSGLLIDRCYMAAVSQTKNCRNGDDVHPSAARSQ